MWGFVDCTSYFHQLGVTKVVLHDASIVIRTSEKAALLVPPGHGKTTIIRMLAGIHGPERGAVLRDKGGWPLGYSGGFRNEMTGEANVRNLARLAGVDPDSLAAYVATFSELGEAFGLPLASYTGRMKAQLGFSVSFGIPVRTFLADDKLAVGVGAFRDKCMKELESLLERCGLIFVTSNPKPAEGICDRFFLLSQHKFVECDDYDDASARLKMLVDDGSTESPDEDVPLFDLA